MAQRFEMHQAAAEAATTIATLDGRLGHLDSAVRALERVVAAARDGGDTEAETRRAVPPRDDRARGRPAGRGAGAVPAGRQCGDRVGPAVAPYGFDARYQQATTAFLRGRWDESLAIATPRASRRRPTPRHSCSRSG